MIAGKNSLDHINAFFPNDFKSQMQQKKTQTYNLGYRNR